MTQRKAIPAKHEGPRFTSRITTMMLWEEAPRQWAKKTVEKSGLHGLDRCSPTHVEESSLR